MICFAIMVLLVGFFLLNWSIYTLPPIGYQPKPYRAAELLCHLNLIWLATQFHWPVTISWSPTSKNDDDSSGGQSFSPYVNSFIPPLSPSLPPLTRILRHQGPWPQHLSLFVDSLSFSSVTCRWPCSFNYKFY